MPIYNTTRDKNPRKPKGCTMTDDVLSYNDFIKKSGGIFLHPDVQQRILMIMGDKKNPKLELTKSEETKIAQNYRKMYITLATIRWCKGESLGVARQHAMAQMNTFVKSKVDIAHPMNKYLMTINNQIIRTISQLNMTDENSDKKINMNPELATKWSVEATKIFQQNMHELNEMYQKYMPVKDVKQQPVNVKFKTANRRVVDMLNHMLAQQQNHQRAA